MLPRILKGFTAYIDGRGYIGRVESCKLPELAVQGEDYRAGGMDAPIEHDMGMAKIESSITLAEYDPAVIKLFGLMSASTAIVLRGAIQRQGEEAVPVVIRLTGGVKQISRDDWKAGDKGSMQIGINCNRYSESINGETVVDIDILNMKRVIGGVDQMQTMRDALGV